MIIRICMLAIIGVLGSNRLAVAEPPDLIFHHGKVVTVDRDFQIAEAFSIKRDRLALIGSNERVIETKGPNTKLIDLGGRTVLPGLIDSHTHPTAASMIEFERPIPDMRTIDDVLKYLQARVSESQAGEWIELKQVFITRLREQRYPTKAELDKVAPKNPLVFATGPDASVNSLALAASGIGRGFKVDGPGKVETDPTTGEPTGILRNCSRYLKIKASGKVPTEQDKDNRLLALIRDYNSVGITGIIDRAANKQDLERYRRLHAADTLPIRMGVSRHIETLGPIAPILAEIDQVAADPLVKGDSMLRIIGIKTFLDGGMLTGSAYMRKPWGISKIYAIDDPEYKGVLFIPPDRLAELVRATARAGLQFTAHSVGDGAVHALLDAYEEVNKSVSLSRMRPCITHSNFMSREAIERAAKLGVVVDIQPAWLYLDARTLRAQFGDERLRYFQPLASLFAAGVVAGGGSDHMQKVGSLRSVNPYNPFLGMWVTIARKAKGDPISLHPEEALTREQAIQFYTINNAKLLFLEDQVGSLEPGKLADFVVLNRDILTCPEDEIKDIHAQWTYLNGKQIFSSSGEK